MTTRCAVIVLAKAPRAGFAKTRLIPAIGAERAAALAERMLVHAVAQAAQAGLGPVELCCTPDCSHPAFERLARTQGVELSEQGGGDLGARMARALARWLAPGQAHAHMQWPRALLIGTDAPGLDAVMLKQADQALRDTDAVFIPTLDGGYALVGLRRPAPALFEGMAWSTPNVMQHTRERLLAAGLRHVELPPVADIDDSADLVHLPAAWRAG